MTTHTPRQTDRQADTNKQTSGVLRVCVCVCPCVRIFNKLCADDTPMVRRAAASKMKVRQTECTQAGTPAHRPNPMSHVECVAFVRPTVTQDFFQVTEKPLILKDLINTFKTLAQDDTVRRINQTTQAANSQPSRSFSLCVCGWVQQDSIRVSCLNAALELAKVLNGDENKTHTLIVVKAAAEDRSWRVRLSLAKQFDQVMDGHRQTGRQKWGWVDVVVWLCVWVCRVSCALRSVLTSRHRFCCRPSSCC